MKRKRENIRLKMQIIAYILSGVIAINPLLLFFLNKSKKNPIIVPNTTEATTYTPEETKTYFELIDEISSNCDIEFNDLTLPKPNESCTYVNDIIYSESLYNQVTELISIIKNNSIDYIGNNIEYTLGFINIDDINKEHNVDQVMIQSIFKDALSDILSNNTSKDLCVLKDLKVVISYSTENNNCLEYKKEDNLIIIYPNNNWEEIKYAIKLELNKIRIDNCNCQNNNLFTYNTLNNASVISELYNTNKTDVFISNDDIKKEALILTLGLFHDELNINDYYKAIFNNDIEALYKFCGANNEEDIYKLNKILYAMDNNIDYNYKVDIFGIIINNLINYTTNNKDFNLKDNLTIFNALKNIIGNNSSQDTEELCNIYVSFLSSHYKQTTTTIINMLNDNEITNYTIALYDICNNFEKSDKVNTFDLFYSNKLILKFPLLKQILILSIYQDYDNNLSNSYTLSKSRNN